MMKREIEKVQKGLDPLGVVRNPDHPTIDTKLAESLNGPEYRRDLRAVTAA
jgi:hypothetical protein